MVYVYIRDRACKYQPSEHIIIANFVFLSLLYNHLHYHNKIFITAAEFNGLSSAAYGIGILCFEQKVLAKM